MVDSFVDQEREGDGLEGLNQNPDNAEEPGEEAAVPREIEGRSIYDPEEEAHQAE